MMKHLLKKEAIDSPLHYGGKDNPYEAIKVIEAWGVGFCLGNVLKYISRAGKKDSVIQELEKAQWYLNREIEKLKKLDESVIKPKPPQMPADRVGSCV